MPFILCFEIFGVNIKDFHVSSPYYFYFLLLIQCNEIAIS